MKRKKIITSLTSCVLIGTMLASTACSAGTTETEGSGSEILSEETEITETQIPVADLSEATVEPLPDEIYTGSEIYVLPVITAGDRELSLDDYIVTYDNNINLGTCTVTVTGNDVTATGILTMTFNIITGDEVCDAEENAGLTAFVDRLYVYFLGRYPSLEEMTDNVRRLRSGSRSGMEIVNMIVCSPEFEARGLDEVAFVQAFYLAVLNRNADEDGLWYNVNLLWNGMSRVDLVNGIMDVEGGEFDNICNSLGITLGNGHVTGAAPIINDGVPSSSFNYTVDGRSVTVHRRIYQFVSQSEDGTSVLDLGAMCAASGYDLLTEDGSFVYGTGVYQLTLADGSMSLTVGGDEVSYYEDSVDEGEETFSVNGTDVTVSLGMAVMIEYSLENVE